MKTGTALLALAICGAIPSGSQTEPKWESGFAAVRSKLGVTGSNPWFPLSPGHQLTYRNGSDTETVTVLPETRKIDGVETRVVEDREMRAGKTVELTRDYYAIDSATGDVYYFGEDVDVYKNGKVVSHEGSWHSGENGATFGLMMPADPSPGRRFYQEQARGLAMDRAEIAAARDRVNTPAGVFEDCVHMIETSPLEPGLRDHKWYARGIGPVKDGKMLLVRHEVPVRQP
jgi:hypothetical protein